MSHACHSPLLATCVRAIAWRRLSFQGCSRALNIREFQSGRKGKRTIKHLQTLRGVLLYPSWIIIIQPVLQQKGLIPLIILNHYRSPGSSVSSLLTLLPFWALPRIWKRLMWLVRCGGLSVGGSVQCPRKGQLSVPFMTSQSTRPPSRSVCFSSRFLRSTKQKMGF